MTALEKMAAALKEALPEYVGDWDEENPDPCIARYVDCGEVDFRVLARAALMAIREPSDAAVEAGVRSGRPLRKIWPAMIDHILNGGE